MNPNQILTLFEDRTTKFSFTPEQRKEILSLEEIWGSQHLTLRADDKLLMKRFVGFVATPQLQIQILPKIYQEGNKSADLTEEKQQSVKVLFDLLQYSGFLSVKDLPDPHHISKLDYDVLEIFIHIFVNKFLHLFRYHVHKKYEEVEENATYIKGKILFQKTILNNGGLKNKHFIQYEEFTEDTLLNQIFKSIMVLLRNLSKSADNKKQLTLAMTYLEDVQLIPLSGIVFEKVRFNRLNEIYRPLFQMARMFYHNQQPGLSAGDERTFTFLVPLNQLFEYALFKLLEDGFSELNWKVQYQKPRKHLDRAKKMFTLKPDLVITEGKVTKIIVDAKYKNPIVNSKVKLAESDVYQMLAYAVRYECDNLFLVYPMFRDHIHLQNPLSSHQIAVYGSNVHLHVLHIDLTVSDIETLKEQLLSAIKEALKHSNC